MKLRVVVFDDNKQVRDSISLVVTMCGHDVLAYDNPSLCPLYLESACTCPREEACADIIITDNNMPQMTGLEFIRRQFERGCKGIIRNKAIMSGDWSTDELAVAASLGLKIFSKPVEVTELIAWLLEREQQIPRERILLDVETG